MNSGSSFAPSVSYALKTPSGGVSGVKSSQRALPTLASAGMGFLVLDSQPTPSLITDVYKFSRPSVAY